jgi:hypothetical protein
LPGFFVGGFDGMIDPYGVFRFVDFFYVRSGCCEGSAMVARSVYVNLSG